MYSGKFHTLPGFPDYFQTLSQRLYLVLDNETEASTKIRDLKVRKSTIAEILLTTLYSLDADIERSGYTCGSQFEGTEFFEMKSDTDTVLVNESYTVVMDIREAQQHRPCLLTIQDPDTPAGYVKLQVVRNGEPCQIPIFEHFLQEYESVDSCNRIVYTLSDERILEGFRIQGPARRTAATDTQILFDLVSALRYRKWPDCASEWLTRERAYNWPQRDLIEYFKQLGCFLVCVGQPGSNEYLLQWRWSFSLQERHLVSCFNSVQLKCYILLKIIKKDIINNALGEDVLTSYHCKTCLLYLIENTPQVLWTPDNLLICLYECLQKIMECVETRNCPNYFIPAENMFTGRMDEQKRIKLRDLLRLVISSDFKYLLSVRTAKLGDRLMKNITGRIPEVKKEYFCHYVMYGSTVECQFGYRLFLRPCIKNTCSRTVQNLLNLSFQLKNIDKVTEHTRQDTIYALSLVLPYVEISLLSVLTVLAKRLHRPNEFILNLLVSSKWHELSLQSDMFSSKLKQASLLLATGFYDISLDILLDLEHKLRDHLSLCCCSGRIYRPSKMVLISEHTTEKVFQHQRVIPCIFYLQAERDLTPPPLCYEKVSLGEGKSCIDVAAVDGKILLYFLLFLNHQHFGREANAAADIANLEWLIETDLGLGHRATAFNILGWIYEKQGFINRAVHCFQQSQCVQPNHNAAIFHRQGLSRWGELAGQ